MSPLENFWRLVGKIEGLFESPDYADSRMIEPTLVEVLSLIRAHPDRRDSFEDAFIEVVRALPKGSDEAVCFCMHELRWSAVMRAAEEERAKARSPVPDHRREPMLRHIIESFSDDWDGRDCYPYFRGQEAPNQTPDPTSGLRPTAGHL